MKLMRWAAGSVLGLLAMAATPSLGLAASGIAWATAYEFAGPGTEYPVVVSIPAGGAVTIYGCLAGWQWCDVDYYGYRGWVVGTYLQSYYQSQPVVIPYYGAQIGIPLVVFNFGYWDSYYRGRPWYSDYGRYAIPGKPDYHVEGQRGGAYASYPPKPIYDGPYHSHPPGNYAYANPGAYPGGKQVYAPLSAPYNYGKPPSKNYVLKGPSAVYLYQGNPQHGAIAYGGGPPNKPKCVIYNGKQVCGQNH